MKEFVTYKYYTNKKERLAIFYKEGIIEVIKCSKKDTFTKKKAKELYNSPIAKRYTIIKQECKNLKEFLDICDKQFCRYIHIIIPTKVYDSKSVYKKNNESQFKFLI